MGRDDPIPADRLGRLRLDEPPPPTTSTTSTSSDKATPAKDGQGAADTVDAVNATTSEHIDEPSGDNAGVVSKTDHGATTHQDGGVIDVKPTTESATGAGDDPPPPSKEDISNKPGEHEHERERAGGDSAGADSAPDTTAHAAVEPLEPRESKREGEGEPHPQVASTSQAPIDELSASSQPDHSAHSASADTAHTTISAASAASAAPATSATSATSTEPEQPKQERPQQSEQAQQSKPQNDKTNDKTKDLALPPISAQSPATSSDAASLPDVTSSMLPSDAEGAEISGAATPRPKPPSNPANPSDSLDATPGDTLEATPGPSKPDLGPGPTPAPVPPSQPAAPMKPPPGPPATEPQPTPARAVSSDTLAAFQTPGASTRISPDLAEFDPFATPAPTKSVKATAGMAGTGGMAGQPPKLPQRPQIRTGSSNSVRSGAAVSSAQSAAQTAQSQSAQAQSRSQSQAAQSQSAQSQAGQASQSQAGPSRQPGSQRSQNNRDSRSNTPGNTPSTPVRSATPRRPSEEEPAFNFAGFLRDLKVKSAEPVARYLKSFLTNFSKKPFTVNEQIKLIRDFLEFIAERMRAVEPWKSQSEAEFDNALEAMEKLVMNRLYPYTFTPQISPSTPITTDDLERDAVFAQRVRLFGWVRESHLDVPESDAAAGFLGFAEQELLKINHYKAPRDKMICILNCCKVIFGLIRHTSGNEAGADAFIPILIFVVLRASPDNMLSNLEYINRFRNPEKLTGEAGYYLSSLSGAIQFIETMDATSLSNITQEEFEANVERAIQDLPSSPSSPRSAPAPSDLSPFATSPGEEAARPLALPATAAALDGTRRFFQRTGDAAKEAVSRPLSAIGKILQDMQAPASASESGESDSDREREKERGENERRRHEHHHRRASAGGASTHSVHSVHSGHNGHSGGIPVPGGTPKAPSRLLAQLGLSPDSRQGSENATPHSTPPPDYREREPYTPVPPSQAFAREREQREREAHSSSTPSHPPLPANYARTHPQQQQRFAPPPPSNLYRRSSQHAHLPPPPSQTPIYAQHAQHSSHAQHPSHAQHAQHPSQHPHPSHAQQPFGLTQEEYDRQREEQRKLEERAREQAHYDRALAQSQREQWDAHTREQSKLANIATLHQMFPALDEEIVQVVLEASGEDLGAAIDRLLEM